MKINLYGEIVSDEDDWIYSLFDVPHCCPGQVREAIGQLGADDELILEINSPGGDVWAGFEIFGLLQACSAHTEAHIIALAASAATTVCSACDTVLASPVAQVMIHQPSAYVEGYANNEEARQLQNLLDSVKASIINSYVVKAGGKTSRQRFEELVDESTYMPVQDAIELGLVDGLLDTDDELLASLTASGGILVKNTAIGTSFHLQSLRDRYEAAVKAGTIEEVPGHPVVRESKPLHSTDPGGEAAPGKAPVPDWKLQAAIDMERARLG